MEELTKPKLTLRARCNVGRKTLMVATKDITKGEEICDSYSMLFQVTRCHWTTEKTSFHQSFPFQDTEKPKRQRFLKEHYRFECRCDACLGKFKRNIIFLFHFYAEETFFTVRNSQSSPPAFLSSPLGMICVLSTCLQTTGPSMPTFKRFTLAKGCRVK